MVRLPAVAGQFYESDPKKLDAQLQGCFTSRFGPGDLPLKRSARETKAILVPHAGYTYSGPCAAWAYKELAESRRPKTYVLLGPNHFGQGSGLSGRDWQTPLGVVQVDKGLLKEVAEATKLPVAEQHHLSEHALEVQLPFLQFINRDAPDFTILPITIGQDTLFTDLASRLGAALAGRDVAYILSTDFTHYGPAYKYLPFSTDLPRRLEELDMGAISLILKAEVRKLKDYLNRTHITMCGYLPVLVYLEMLRLTIPPAASMLRYYRSAEVTGDWKNSVSYASIVWN